MSKGSFVIAFTLLSMTFAPVVFLPTLILPIYLVSPCCFPIYEIFLEGGWSGIELFLRVVIALQLAIYWFVFRFAGRKCFAWTQNFHGPEKQFPLQLLVLALVTATSLIPIIHVISFGEPTHFRNFWGALIRFCETYDSR